MNFVSKFFDDLTTRELYELLKARPAVFVVEQNCVYQDIDGRDPDSLSLSVYAGIFMLLYET